MCPQGERGPTSRPSELCRQILEAHVADDAFDLGLLGIGQTKARKSLVWIHTGQFTLELQLKKAPCRFFGLTVQARLEQWPRAVCLRCSLLLRSKCRQCLPRPRLPGRGSRRRPRARSGTDECSRRMPRRPSGHAPARSRRRRALRIENPAFSGDLCVANATDYALPWHLMALLRHRAKRKAPSDFAKCLTSLVAGAGYAQRCPVELGVPMEAVIAA